MANDDYEDGGSPANNRVEDDLVEAFGAIDDYSEDNDDHDDEQPIKYRQLSLAELEDIEEARQAALELEELQSRTSQSIISASATAAVAGEASASSSPSPTNRKASSINDDEDIRKRNEYAKTNSDNNKILPSQTYLPYTPQREIDLAQKRDILQNTRLNEMFAEEDAAAANRQAQIRVLMEEDDKIWKTERRKRMMGKYANVESWEEVERLMDEDRRKEARGMWFLVVFGFLVRATSSSSTRISTVLFFSPLCFFIILIPKKLKRRSTSQNRQAFSSPC